MSSPRIRSAWRLSCTLAVAVCFLTAASGAMAEIVCEGFHEGHLQGIAAEPGKAIYWSFKDTLVKTTMAGSLVKKQTVPSHHGDLAFHDGKLYIAVNLGKFNEEPGAADSWVYVYDANELSLLAKHSVQEVVHGAGGIAWHDGHFYVIGGLPKGYSENYVYEYDASFAFIKRHVLDSGYTLMGIQTACRWQGYWWFGCYGLPRVLIKADDTFHVLARYEEDWSIGMEGVSDTQCLRGSTGNPPGEKRYWGKATLDTPGKGVK